MVGTTPQEAIADLLGSKSSYPRSVSEYSPSKRHFGIRAEATHNTLGIAVFRYHIRLGTYMTTYGKIDQLFKALADETRLRILNLLMDRELCVCDLVDTLKMGQSKISRHLAYLRRAGLVDDRKEGLWVYYSLAAAKDKFHKGLYNCLRTCFSDMEILRKDQKTLKHSRRRC